MLALLFKPDWMNAIFHGSKESGAGAGDEMLTLFYLTTILYTYVILSVFEGL